MEPGFSRGPSKKPLTDAERARILAELRRETAQRAQGYRERALKLFPHVCASCGREFKGPRLKELTVHHKDHNHDNNPPDGSNWELLCIYCHENEHARIEDAKAGGSAREDEKPPATHKPFAGLDGLVKGKPKR